MNKISSHDYVRNFTRLNDYNLYLVHFFMPVVSRQNALTLMALHCELKTIPVKARDPSMIIIRLKWWYDNVMMLFNDKDHTDSPVLEALAPIIKNKLIDKKDFENYFERFEAFFRNQETDVDAFLYYMLDKLIVNKDAKSRFSDMLQYHDSLPPETQFRALRLWLRKIRFR